MFQAILQAPGAVGKGMGRIGDGSEAVGWVAGSISDGPDSIGGVAGSIWDASDGIRGRAASIGQRRACRGLLGHRQEGYAAPKRNEYKQPYDQQPMISIKMLKIRNYCTRASPPGPLIGF